MHWAALYQEVAVAQLFIDSNADLNVAQADGYTPLHLAANNGHVAICRVLLAAGDRINVNVTEDEGLTPLHIAASSGHSDVVRVFARDGRASTSARCQRSRNPLHWAALRDEVIRILVNEMGADVNAPQSSDGWTALHLAAFNGYSEVVDTLIYELFAFVSPLDGEDFSPEERARQEEHTDIADMLKTNAAFVRRYT